MYTQAVVRAGQASDAASVACAYQQRGSNSVIQRYLDYYRPCLYLMRFWQATNWMRNKDVRFQLNITLNR